MSTKHQPGPTAEEMLALRVWLAGVRDDAGQAEGLRTLARAGCRLLDLRGRVEARNLRDGIDDTLADLLGQLEAAGLRPPPAG